jgi:hypothetical protein
VGDLPGGVKLSDMPAQTGVGDGDKHMKLWGKALRGPPKEGVGDSSHPDPKLGSAVLKQAHF